MTAPFTPAAGACDCHVHVYDAAYPLAPTATFVPPDAPVQRLMVMHQALGIQRAVVVQPTGYGFDNRCTMAAVAALAGNGRAVVVVDADTPDATLQALHDGGVTHAEERGGEAGQLEHADVPGLGRLVRRGGN